MQFYPLGRSDFATRTVSASLTLTGSFLTIPEVPTASSAVNIKGPQGPSGSTFSFTGVAGPVGPQGAEGPQGLGVYLLSFSRRAFCGFPITLGYSQVGPISSCNRYNSSLTDQYYSITTTLSLGDPLYTDLIASPPYAENGYYSDGTNFWIVTSGFSSSPTLCTDCEGLGAVCVENAECCSGNCTNSECSPEL